MICRDTLSEYVRGSLWVLPTLSVAAALAAGSVLSVVSVGVHAPLAFQGTPDDARNLLIGIAGTMVTVIALMLGLTVVALQLSSTQFSPRLLRNFLRDRPTQVVLSAFVATFAYSMAGLYTVGVSGGNHTAGFPRLAVSGSIVLLFISLGLLVFFADHLVHSIQVDAIMHVVEQPLTVIRDGLLPGSQDAPEPRPGPRRSPPAALATCRRCTAARCWRTRPGTGPACGSGPGSASTWSPGPRSRGSGPRRPAPRHRTGSCSRGSWRPESGSGSSGPCSKTPRSISGARPEITSVARAASAGLIARGSTGYLPARTGSWSTRHARHCPRRSTTPAPRSRPSITCR
jgi:hypothetical protein